MLPAGQSCVFEGGPIRTADVDALARFTKDRQAALDALFARTLLGGVKVAERDVLARERQVIARSFGGKRAAYERALARKGATPALARAILRDDLRRRAYAASLKAAGSTQTPLEALADRATAVLAGATCVRDELPGWGWFPARDDRDFVVPPLARKLPFLLGDRTPPAAPTGLTATAVGGVTLTWRPVAAVDLAGYAVYRAASPSGPWAPISKLPPVRPYFLDPKAPAGAVYAVRAIDTSGNVGAPAATAAP